VGRFSATTCGKIFSILIVQDTINLAGQMVFILLFAFANPLCHPVSLFANRFAMANALRTGVAGPRLLFFFLS
jgi:hypothetical protein